MSTARGAKLKAQYNRVRTSTALRGNDMWENTIGVEFDQAGSNAAIEASIYAPTHGGGGGRSQRRELAQQLIKTTGYQPSVTDYQGLLTLAKAQGSLGAGTRGACKLCGGMGHLTKQCTNFLTGHTAAAGADPTAKAGPSGAGGAGPSLGLLPDPDAISDISDLSSSDSDSEGSGRDKGSGSDSGSDSDRDRKRKSKKRKRSSKEKRSKDKKEKRSKDKKRKHKKEKSSKRKRREDSASDSD